MLRLAQGWHRASLLFAFALAASGCHGTLELWGVNVGVGVDDDDDDDGPPGLDFSQYDGVEYINIEWDPEQNDNGVEDCRGEFEAFGANTTLDDDNLCPDCDEIWTITLTAEGDALDCVNDGTGLGVSEVVQRKVGIEFTSSTAFVVHRNTGDVDHELGSVGQGAINDSNEFTWSGIDGWSTDVPNRQFEWFFSGEGGF